MLKLSNTIKVMVPTKDNDGNAIDYMKLVQGVTKLVGGSTMYDAKGLWIDNNQVYKDSNKLVEFNTDSATAYEALTEVVRDIVGTLLREGGQLAVWLQVNGTTFIMDSDTDKDFIEVSKALNKEVE